jgi:hypothetical protein
VFPTTITSVAADAFKNCMSLTEITSLMPSPSKIYDEYVFPRDETWLANVTVTVRNRAAIADYSEARLWKTFGTITAPTITVTPKTADPAQGTASVTLVGYDVTTPPFYYEDDVTFTAVPVSPASFAGWWDGEAIVSTDPTYTMEKVTEDITLTAMWDLAVPTLSLSAVQDGLEVTLTVSVYHEEENNFLEGTVIFYSGDKELNTVTLDGTEGEAVHTKTHDGAGDRVYKAVFTSSDGSYPTVEHVLNYEIEHVDQDELVITPVTGKVVGDVPFQLEYTGGSGEGGVTFSVPPSNGVLSVTSGGVVTIIGAGSATVKLVKAGDSHYSSMSTELEITIGTVGKESQSAPSAPTAKSVSTSSVTLNAIPGAEYRLGTNGAWQSSAVFSGLTANTKYTFYARLAATDTHNASLTSAALTVTTEPEIKKTVSVLDRDRVIPGNPETEAVVIAPSGNLSAELTAGPNPAAKSTGRVGFFRQGKSVWGTLSVYDVSGNVIRKIQIADKSIGTASRREVGSWDLRDSKGILVSEGTYLARGRLKASDGKSEKVSLILGVR